MKNLYILCLLCLLALTGCHEKDPLPELTIEQTEYTLGAVGYRTAAVLFNTNVEWTLSVSYEGTDTDWLTATPTSGMPGENTVELTAKENTGEGPRTATITILYGGKSQKLDIVQTGPELNVGQTEYTLGAAEGRIATVSFNTNVEWTLSVSYEGTDTDWLTATPTSGMPGENTVELTAKENDGDATRTAYVDFLFGEKTQRLNITQTGMSDTTDITTLFDPEFARILKEKGYIPDAEKILPKDIIGITVLHISGYSEKPGSLTSLKGIEYFKHLESLFCNYNQLTTLDLSKNTQLSDLWCANNQITSLDISNNTQLLNLRCENNQLKNIDISNNYALDQLNCNDNQLKNLDISNNTLLTSLSCWRNLLTELDVSNNTELIELDCRLNQLTELNLYNNVGLKILWCNNNNLTALNISKNTALIYLWCEFNQLNTLDISKNTALIWLCCSDNHLSMLDVSSNTELIYLYCHDNQLTTLDVSNNTLLSDLWCYDNNLTTLDIRKNTKVRDLRCNSNQLTKLYIRKNTQLTRLWCYNNPGDGISVFPVTAWFGNDAIPSDFTEGSWTYGGRTIYIDYRKAE